MPVDGGVIAYLARVGRPIRYGYVRSAPAAGAYQTVFAREPGSAEMPSAGRPFTDAIVTDLVTAAWSSPRCCCTPGCPRRTSANRRSRALPR